MKTVNAVLAEVLGLFVDDASFVVAIAAWVGTCVVCLRLHLLDATWDAVLLAVGLALILAENAVRSARASSR